MPLTRLLTRLSSRTERVPVIARHGFAVVFVLLALLIRYGATFIGWPEQGYPFVFFLGSVMVTSAMGPGGAGYLATALSALLCLPFVPDADSGFIRADWVMPVVVFIGLGAGITALVQSLYHALDNVSATERRRALLLREYRHRSRNDLMTINALLLLRRRLVPDMSAKEALKEAAQYTVDMARVHSRMEGATHDREDVAFIDSAAFVVGVCADMVPPIIGVDADSHPLPTERGMQVGMLLCEMVRDARVDPEAKVQVFFEEHEEDFVLCVIDDRQVSPTEDSLRTKMCGLLAKQLRGQFDRIAPERGGSIAKLRFPVAAPTLAAARVGS